VTVWDSRAAYDAFAPVFAQVDQPRAQAYFKEAQALCERGFKFGTPEILPVHHFLPPLGA
jgi:hypothetical protein